MLSFGESCRAIWESLLNYVGDYPLMMALSAVACVYLLIASPGFRKRLLWPIVVLALLVFNPVLYSLVYANTSLPFVAAYGLRYWRFFWMLPQAIVIGLAAADLIRRFSRPLARCAALTLAAGIIVATGQNMYYNEAIFSPARSPYKLSRGPEEVCEVILADDPNPLCLFDKVVTPQARQYSGNIRQVWGRNGSWSVFADPEGYEIYNVLNSEPRDLERVFAFAVQRGVTHISFLLHKSENRAEVLELAGQYGYKKLHRNGRRLILRRAEA